MTINWGVVGAAVCAGLVVWWLATSAKRQRWSQGSRHAGGLFSTWRSTTGGMSRPFYTTPWFLVWVALVVLAALLLS